MNAPQQPPSDPAGNNPRRTEILRQAAIPVVSVIIGLVAFALTANYLREQQRQLQTEYDKLQGRQERIDVVVAKKPLPAGTTIRMQDFGVISQYKFKVGDRAVLQEDHMRVLGKKLLRPIDGRQPLFWSDVEGGRSGRDRFSDDIVEGLRAKTIDVSGSAAVSGLIRPADRVDVLITYTTPAASGEELETRTLTLLQDVTVIACGQQTAKQVRTRGAGSYSEVTLQVTPREVELLTHAMHAKARLSLSLRNPADGNYERELPRVDFEKIESTVQELNEHRQQVIRGRRGTITP